MRAGGPASSTGIGTHSTSGSTLRAEARAWLERHARPRRASDGDWSRFRFLGDPSSEADADHVRRCKEWQRKLYDGGWAAP